MTKIFVNGIEIETERHKENEFYETSISINLDDSDKTLEVLSKFINSISEEKRNKFISLIKK